MKSLFVGLQWTFGEGSVLLIILLTSVLLCHNTLAGTVPNFEGVYRDGGIKVQLQSAGSGYTGTFHLDGKALPCSAKVKGQRLEGTFQCDGIDFGFTGALQAGTLILESDGATYRLQKEVANPLARAGRTSPENRDSNPLTKSPPGSARDTSEVAGSIRFKRFTLADAMAGCDALTLLAPAHWQAEGRFDWRSHPTLPVLSTIRVHNPAGHEMLLAFPPQQFVDGLREAHIQMSTQFGAVSPQFAQQQAQSMFPEGGTAYGCTIRKQVHDALEYIATVAIPKYRGDPGSYRMVAKEPAPELAELVRKREAAYASSGTVPIAYSAGRVRIEREIDGRAIEEDVYCVLYNFQVRLGQTVTTYWGDSGTVCQIADKGKLDELSHVFRAINLSCRPTAQWFNAQAQVKQIVLNGIRQRQQIAFQAGQRIAGIQSEVSDMIMQQYKDRQASQDRVQKEFIKTIRGVEEYYNPYEERPVELPSGYKNVWVNGSGEYLLTDQVGLNPNIGSIREWKQLDVVPP